ncbi:MAG TPA: hypothetical protein PK264_23150, partial [Hyphomicrobiaceae bacterium]|nr:hypothetical protein [Hyphomicrobiaceae bacterium]
MSELMSETRGFLVADGFAVGDAGAGLLLANRTSCGKLEERRVWVGGAGAAPWTAERIAASFATLPAVGAATSSFLLVPETGGLSRDMLAVLKAHGIQVRVPVQFFDTPYKWEPAEFGTQSGADAASVFHEFAKGSERLMSSRVAQPFHALSGLGEQRGGFQSGPDLVEHLVEELTTPAVRPRLIVVAGAAGAGKSVAFAALFARLHAHFLGEKRHHRSAGRPVLFLPQHIQEQQVSSLAGLLSAVASTDAAQPTSPDLMRWLNAAGRTIWMFDGLDEFFSGESDFLPAIEEQIAPERRGRIVICTRDSLLTSSSGLAALLDRHVRTAGQGTVAIYEVDRWQRPSQRALAYQRLEGRAPVRLEAADPPKVAAFLKHLDASPAAAELATLPFYCSLMLGAAAQRGSGIAPLTEQDLLAEAVDGMIDREAEKLSGGEAGFAWDVFSGAETFADLAEIVEKMGHERFSNVLERGHIHAVLRQIGRDRLVELVE